MDDLQRFANFLYQLRRKEGLSQEQLADSLGVSRQTVSKWERGESWPDTGHLVALSKIFNLSVDELISGKGLQEQPACDGYEESDVPAEEDGNDDERRADLFSKKGRMGLLKVIYPVIALIAMLAWGYFGGAWKVSWVVLLTIPVYFSIFECVRSRRVSDFAYPILIVALYLAGGIREGWWHPHWALFITVPLFYLIADAIDKKR